MLNTKNKESLWALLSQAQTKPRLAKEAIGSLDAYEAASNQAEIGFDRLSQRLKQIETPNAAYMLTTLAKKPGKDRWNLESLLFPLFGFSPYLTQLATREAEYLANALTETPETLLNGLLSDAARRDCTHGELEKALRVGKRRLALILALLDIHGVWPLQKITKALSDFAAICLNSCLIHALEALIAEDKIDPKRDDAGLPLGFFMLGMGKLGAHELNYSSDIDVIALYDPESLSPRDPDRLRQDMVRATQSIVRLMETRTGDGYVFRTDLRLRPDPGMTPLAMTVGAAEAYYESTGQNWERAAMIKARPVAGDRAAGTRFLQKIKPFIWRRHLDFAAVADIQSIKRQINSHRGGQDIALEGHNIKLGRGGIREIEFFAQTQQLIWGGRASSLRQRGTLQTLSLLTELDHISQETADCLTKNYTFLRILEHRLQMQNDEQTQKLPEDKEAFDRLGAFFGMPSPDAFRQRLKQCLTEVSDIYDALFEDTSDLGGSGALVFTGPDDHPDTLQTLKNMGFDDPSQIASRIRAWHYGRYRSTRSERARQILTELTPPLLNRLSDAQNPSQAFAKFDAFLSALPSGVQIFSLFHSKPEIADLVCDIMGKAPRLADWLSRTPALLDSVLGAAHRSKTQEEYSLYEALAAALVEARDLQDALDVVRRWANDRRFLIGVDLLEGRATGVSAGPKLSGVAEASIKNLQPWVYEDFTAAHGLFSDSDPAEADQEHGLALVAFGKLGGADLAPMSDLDLVFIYRTPEGADLSSGQKPLAPMTYYTRFCQRLSTAITAPTPEGELYDLDARLRPNGRSGPLATNFSTLRPYYEKEAWTWERMALTRARPISGPAQLQEDIAAEIDHALRLKRDPNMVLRDVYDMRQRIEKQHSADRPWTPKYRRGGLLDLEFILQYLQLILAPEGSDVLSPYMPIALSKLKHAGALSKAQATDLQEALDIWRNVQALLRLTAEDRFNPTTAPDGQKALLASAFGLPNFDALSRHLDDVAARVAQHYVAILEEPAKALQ